MSYRVRAGEREERPTVFPVDNFAVRVVGVLRAEGRVADETLEHDRTDTGKRSVAEPRSFRGGE